MDYRFLLKRIRYILFNPARAWSYIRDEKLPIKYVRNSYFFPILALVTLCAFTGSIIFTNATLSPVYSVFMALKYFLLHLIVVFFSAVVLSEITKALDLGKNFLISFKLIVYSLTPFYLCQVISHLFESLVFINILSLYGLYIFWTGAEKLLDPPEHKKMPMLIAIFVVVAGFFIAGSIVLSSVVDRIYFGFFA